MKKSSWKLVLCLALAVVMLACTALAAIAQGDVAADTTKGATITVSNDGKLTVSVTGLTAGTQYALIQVKVQSNAATAADLLATPPAYDVEEDKILYIDQDAAADGTVTFSNFLPKSAATSLFVLGGGNADPKIVGAMVAQGTTVTGTVALKGATAATEAKVEALDASGAVLVETTATTAANGTGTYTLDGIPAEAVKLKVSTADKYAAREYAITADTTEQNVELWAKGDVVGNGDGIKINDVNAVFNHFKKVPGKMITDEYTLAVGDVIGNGDGIKINDVNAIFNHFKKVPGKNLW